MEATQKNDFVEIKFTGYAEGKVFDSNVEEDLKKVQPEAKPAKVIAIVGQGMVVPGLDKALEEKEINKDYEIKISAKEGFGERDRNLVKTVPLKAFTEKNVYPKPGMVFALDNYIVKIVAVSGGRVIVDFNNPLAGRELTYKFKIINKIEDIKEKISFVFEYFLRFVPEFEVREQVIVKGPKQLEVFIHGFNNKFKELLGKEMKFELKEEKALESKAENANEKKEISNNVSKSD